MATAPTIQDKAPKPSGLLPKNVQSWLLVGLAVLMVLIMWLTGGKKPPSPTKVAPPLPAVLPPLEVNEAKIVEMQKRIEDLQREQAVAQGALAQQMRTLQPAEPNAQPGQPQTYGAPAEKPEDPIQVERKKRDYLSLFASNVALSFRKGAAQTHLETPQAAPAVPDASSAQLAELLRPLQPPTVPLTPILQPKLSQEGGKEESRPVAPPAVPATATGKTYVIFEGTTLEALLMNRLDGQFAGPIECLLTNDVYSHDRQHLLIPSGTKLLGETKRVEALARLASR